MQFFTVVSNVLIHSLFGLIYPISVNCVYNKMYFIFLFKQLVDHINWQVKFFTKKCYCS